MVQTVCAPARAQQLVNPYELYPYPLTLTNPSPNPHQIFPEILSEQCAMQEHRIVEEAGRNQMQVARAIHSYTAVRVRVNQMQVARAIHSYAALYNAMQRYATLCNAMQRCPTLSNAVQLYSCTASSVSV